MLDFSEGLTDISDIDDRLIDCSDINLLGLPMNSLLLVMKLPMTTGGCLKPQEGEEALELPALPLSLFVAGKLVLFQDNASLAATAVVIRYPSLARQRKEKKF